MKTESDTTKKDNFEVILYYKYTHIDNPEKFRNEQFELCSSLELKGRIIIAEEGINGTLEGKKENVYDYCQNLQCNPKFKDIHIKRSAGTGESFPKLSVKVRKEIVSSYLEEDENVNPSEFTGKRVLPDELHSWLSGKKDVKIIDMRNDYEFDVGHFENSVFSGMKNFRDLKKVSEELSDLKNKTVVTVCTGGVRCEKASGYLLKKGFKDVYQLDGGIVSYMEKYPGGKFKGSLYVFDKRILMHFDQPENHTVVGKCFKCACPSENYINCINKECNRHFICCERCLKGKKTDACSTKCGILTQKSKFKNFLGSVLGQKRISSSKSSPKISKTA